MTSASHLLFMQSGPLVDDDVLELPVALTIVLSVSAAVITVRDEGDYLPRELGFAEANQAEHRPPALDRHDRFSREVK